MSCSLGFCVRLCICASDSFLSIYCCARSSSKIIYCGWIVDIVDIIWHGDCNDELLTGNVHVGRKHAIEMALFRVWTIPPFFFQCHDGHDWCGFDVRLFFLSHIKSKFFHIGKCEMSIVFTSVSHLWCEILLVFWLSLPIQLSFLFFPYDIIIHLKTVFIHKKQ